MKKILLMAAAVAMTAMTFTACNNGSSAKLEDAVDSLTYDLALGNGEGLKQYMSMQLGVDTAYLDQFIEGIKEGALNEPDSKKDAYFKGLGVGQQIQQMVKNLSNEVYSGDSTQSVKTSVFVAGIIDALKNRGTKSGEQAMADFEARMEPIKQANLEKQFGEWKQQNEKYLADNKKAEGVTTLASGVQYKVIEAGSGDVPTDTSKVAINYVGKTIEGTEFDSSYSRNEPITVDMSNPTVIPGWVEILKIMPVGAKWEVTIPQEQAYRMRNMGQIKPFSTLIFTMERVK